MKEQRKRGLAGLLIAGLSLAAGTTLESMLMPGCKEDKGQAQRTERVYSNQSQPARYPTSNQSNQPADFVEYSCRQINSNNYEISARVAVRDLRDISFRYDGRVIQVIKDKQPLYSEVIKSPDGERVVYPVKDGDKVLGYLVPKKINIDSAFVPEINAGVHSWQTIYEIRMTHQYAPGALVVKNMDGSEKSYKPSQATTQPATQPAYHPK